VNVVAGILAAAGTAALFYATEYAWKAATEERAMRDRLRVIGPDRRAMYREPGELPWKRDGWF
jgi:hypothetical protein